MAKELQVEVGRLSEAILKELDMYSDEVVRMVNSAAEKVAKETVKILKSTSPEKSGDYAKGWRQKVTEKTVHGTEIRSVYNATKPGLTHLLEHGHLKVLFGERTSDRVEGIPHILPAEVQAVKMFEEEVLKE